VPNPPDGKANLLIPFSRNFNSPGLLVSAFLQGATAAGKAVNVKAPRFREQDIPVAITTLIQVLVVQLIDLEVLTVEQAEQIFDGAAKRSSRLKAAPDAERVIQHLHDGLNWDQYYKLAADRRRYGQHKD
jgi:hypothetical protein